MKGIEGDGPRTAAGSLRWGALLLGGLVGCSDGEATGDGSLPRVALGGRPPVVLVIIDTLRADRLGCYGYGLDTSPRIDAWADGAYLFELNSTQCNSTFPSMTSIFTGLYPRTHRNYVPVPLEESMEANREVSSLAERLGEVGYETLAVVSHPFFDDRPADTALRRGWDEFDAIPRDRTVREREELANARFTNERAFALLEKYERAGTSAPPFLWVHYFDPHTPYDPPAAIRDRFLDHHLAEIGEQGLRDEIAALEPAVRVKWFQERFDDERAARLILASSRALYDAEVLATDAGVGELFDRLEQMGILDEAIVVVMADHGENMSGPEAGHGRIAFTHLRLYEGVTSTPLIVRLPGQTTGVRSASLTQNIDVLPTIVQLLGLAPGDDVEGKSLVPLLREPDATIHHEVFVESSDHLEKAVKTPEWKYIEPRPGELAEIFQWRADPGERNDLAGEVDSAISAALASRLGAFRPEDRLTLRVLPAAEPFTVSVDLTLDGARITDVDGPGRLGSDGRSYHLEVTVGDQPVEVALHPDARHTAYHWRIRADGPLPIQRRVHLGRTPLEESCAFPEYVADPAGAVTDPVFSLTRRVDEPILELAIAPQAALGVPELELRFVDDREAKGFRIVAVEGFEHAGREERGFLGRGRTHVLTGSAGRAAHALVSYAPADADPVVLPRLGGRWPAPERVSWNGAAVKSDEIAFVFPLPLDGRITATLLVRPDDAELPPGSIVLGFEGSIAPITIDTAALSADEVEALRALGYVR